jgi:hypothetical protein
MGVKRAAIEPEKEDIVMVRHIKKRLSATEGVSWIAML